MNSQDRDLDVKRGADDLQVLVEWELRDRPHALASARRWYVDFCLRLHRTLKRARRKRL
jgi:hypothetical protein